MASVAHRRQRARRRLLRRTIMLLGVLAVFWLVGLAWFATLLPAGITDPTSRTDAIVVLTGGSGRLDQGLRLLEQGMAGKLLVSGVYHGVDVEHLLEVFRKSPGGLECCISLGYEADNTRGNASESAAWMRAQGFKSLRLVTAAYHMPRSLLEFRNAMPEAGIVPHPVFPANFRQEDWWRWPGSASLLVSEYNKYLLARLRQVLQR